MSHQADLINAQGKKIFVRLNSTPQISTSGVVEFYDDKILVLKNEGSSNLFVIRNPNETILCYQLILDTVEEQTEIAPFTLPKEPPLDLSEADDLSLQSLADLKKSQQLQWKQNLDKELKTFHANPKSLEDNNYEYPTSFFSTKHTTKKVPDNSGTGKNNCSDCQTKKAEGKGNTPCTRCNTIHDVLNRYYQANIPSRYWLLKMDKENFKGDDILMKVYLEYTADIPKTYAEGGTLCFSGNFGTGKTFTITSILKRFLEKGYTGLYCTLEDIIANIGDSIARQELLSTDLLVMDEFDLRFCAQSEKAIDLFGRNLETIIRHRLQNNLPTLFATNSPNYLDGFNGSIKQALTSLFSYVKVVPVIGKDFRKEEIKNK